MRVVWAQPAQDDVHEVFSYIALDKPGAAEQVVKRLTDAGNKLAQMPLRGRLGKLPHMRELVVQGLPYILVYEVLDEIVLIHRVAHGAQQR